MALSDNLISYYSLDEASGDAIDAHSTNDLTETSGTIASASGKVGNCRDFEVGDTEYFTIADNTDFSTGDITFSMFAWVNAEDGGFYPGIIGKDNFPTAREYRLYLHTNSLTPRLGVSSDGVNLDGIVAWGSNLSTATWYFIAAGHSASANEIWISVDGGTPVTSAHSIGVADTTCAFNIGGEAGFEWDGLIDEVAFFKRDIRSDLASFYNSGNGLSYADIVGGAFTWQQLDSGLYIPPAFRSPCKVVAY